MCWVMPPASPATTSASRTASSSDVLPWSTWPMIVTTGGRSTRSSAASSNSGSSSTSSAAWTISISLSNSSARTWIASSDSVWVSVAISPSCISFLMTSGIGDAEVLGDVLDRRAGVDPDRVGLERASCPAGPARRRRHGAGGRRGAAGGAGGRAGRRRGRPGGARPASRSRRGGRRRRRRGRARPGARSASGAWRGLSPSAGASAPAPLVLWAAAAARGLLRLFLVQLRAAGERAVRGVLVDGRGGSLDLDPGIGQPLQHLG